MSTSTTSVTNKLQLQHTESVLKRLFDTYGTKSAPPITNKNSHNSNNKPINNRRSVSSHSGRRKNDDNNSHKACKKATSATATGIRIDETDIDIIDIDTDIQRDTIIPTIAAVRNGHKPFLGASIDSAGVIERSDVADAFPIQYANNDIYSNNNDSIYSNNTFYNNIKSSTTTAATSTRPSTSPHHKKTTNNNNNNVFIGGIRRATPKDMKIFSDSTSTSSTVGHYRDGANHHHQFIEQSMDMYMG
eukprot:gene3738-7421_t